MNTGGRKSRLEVPIEREKSRSRDAVPIESLPPGAMVLPQMQMPVYYVVHPQKPPNYTDESPVSPISPFDARVNVLHFLQQSPPQLRAQIEEFISTEIKTKTREYKQKVRLFVDDIQNKMRIAGIEAKRNEDTIRRLRYDRAKADSRSEEITQKYEKLKAKYSRKCDKYNKCKRENRDMKAEFEKRNLALLQRESSNNANGNRSNTHSLSSNSSGSHCNPSHTQSPPQRRMNSIVAVAAFPPSRKRSTSVDSDTPAITHQPPPGFQIPPSIVASDAITTTSSIIMSIPPPMNPSLASFGPIPPTHHSEISVMNSGSGDDYCFDRVEDENGTTLKKSRSESRLTDVSRVLEELAQVVEIVESEDETVPFGSQPYAEPYLVTNHSFAVKRPQNNSSLSRNSSFCKLEEDRALDDFELSTSSHPAGPNMLAGCVYRDIDVNAPLIMATLDIFMAIDFKLDIPFPIVCGFARFDTGTRVKLSVPPTTPIWQLKQIIGKSVGGVDCQRLMLRIYPYDQLLTCTFGHSSFPRLSVLTKFTEITNDALSIEECKINDGDTIRVRLAVMEGSIDTSKYRRNGER